MELVIMKILYDKDDNYNIRTWMSQDEEVILDFLEIENKLNKENIEEILSEMELHGNSMELSYNQRPVREEYRVKLIDMNGRKLYLEI